MNPLTKATYDRTITLTLKLKNIFCRTFNVGINPVNITVQSFTYTCTTYRNAKGVYFASWR